MKPAEEPAHIQAPAQEEQKEKENPTTNPNTYMSQGDGGVSKPPSTVAKEPSVEKQPEVEQPKEEKKEDQPMPAAATPPKEQASTDKYKRVFEKVKPNEGQKIGSNNVTSAPNISKEIVDALKSGDTQKYYQEI